MEISREKAVLRSKIGPLTLTIALPTGGEVKAQFTEKNNYTCEVPVTPTYKNWQGREVVAHPNWPQALLDEYGDPEKRDWVELVEMKKEEVVKPPSVRSRKKEKANEKAVG